MEKRFGKSWRSGNRLALSLALIAAASACTDGGGDAITLTTDAQGVDPTVLEVPVAFIRRPLPDFDSEDLELPDLREPLAFNPGAELIIKDQSAVSALEVNVSDRMLEIVAEEEGVPVEELAIDIKGLESSFDGSTLVFAARIVPEPIDANLEETTWNLWFLDMETLEPSYVIRSRIKRNDGIETGGGQDIDPHFMPDDRIVFSSTRQVAEQARQLNEGRAQLFARLTEGNEEPAAVLHIYDPQQRNEEFKQISFNPDHDLDPMVMSSGEIVFSRWDSDNNHVSLYQISPSGLNLMPLFGYDSRDSGTDGSPIEYTQPRELDDGRIITLIKPFESQTLGGAIAIVDAENFASANQPVVEGASGEGQEFLTDTEIRTDGLLSLGGQFASVYPLRDGTGRVLVSWTDCRLIEVPNDVVVEEPPVVEDPPPEGTVENERIIPCTLGDENDEPADPLYGAWVYDTVGDTQRPVVIAEEGFWISEIIAAEPRDFPSVMPLPDNFNPELAIENKGQLIIDSVYDFDGEDRSPAGITEHRRPATPAFEARPARFLRVYLPVPLPDEDIFEVPRFAFGVNRGAGFREIIGYVPVEPDGSVTVTVPAERAFGFSILDANGRRIGRRHDRLLQLGPGEILRCTGCHDSGNEVPHGRLNTQPESSNPGATDVSGGLGFPNTDIDNLFATEIGRTMAETWDFHRPVDNETVADRPLALDPHYIDEWTSPALTPEATIDDRAYDLNWEGIPPEYPIIAPKLDASAPDRIVINYEDHIQPIWERTRAEVMDAGGNLFTNCVGCHTSLDNSVVPAGQLDLTTLPSDIDPEHFRAYRELLSGDNEQWIDAAGNIADRLRLCEEIIEEVDEEGNVTEIVLTFTENLGIGSPMRAGRANSSNRFFNCFEGGTCGLPPAPALPANCTEDGTAIPRTQNTINHNGMLSPAELRLLSEWLDIGAQYYNNPFDGRLVD
jgi:hypothetical protein